MRCAGWFTGHSIAEKQIIIIIILYVTQTKENQCVLDLLSVRGTEKIVGDVRWKNVFQKNFVDRRHRFHFLLLHAELASPDEVQLGRDLRL